MVTCVITKGKLRILKPNSTTLVSGLTEGFKLDSDVVFESYEDSFVERGLGK
jgi:hypothetical protein